MNPDRFGLTTSCQPSTANPAYQTGTKKRLRRLYIDMCSMSNFFIETILKINITALLLRQD